MKTLVSLIGAMSLMALSGCGTAPTHDLHIDTVEVEYPHASLIVRNTDSGGVEVYVRTDSETFSLGVGNELADQQQVDTNGLGSGQPPHTLPANIADALPILDAPERYLYTTTTMGNGGMLHLALGTSDPPIVVAALDIPTPELAEPHIYIHGDATVLRPPGPTPTPALIVLAGDSVARDAVVQWSTEQPW
ncbi:hypothetical protein IEU95_01050 [Hoyosella rhizosphaerae]|uniref:Uncharacterized protein n=1 Tax=Hoyosella rhizosphaerae TaxID=1755582 RepID=A0A916UKK7_9ACTN|nr:hypothetical protein [Hoyosella rhizosphaerae]MBN4925407.1 hypothetical protein [Hoyosella rhizosphaerae]GGC75437.1 hypothetical protein GCM10011410_30960 [Hoyosella rhizosphaerae]